MKRALSFLLTSVLVCTAVYAQTNDYNVYNPNEYTNEQTQSGIEYGGIIEFVIDYSGSMAGIVEKTKKTVHRLYPHIPKGTKVGLRVFGQGGENIYQLDDYSFYSVYNTLNNNTKQFHGIYTGCLGKPSGCGGSLQVLPVNKLYDQNTFSQAMDKYPPGGGTPLVYGLYLSATQDLAKFPASSKKKLYY